MKLFRQCLAYITITNTVRTSLLSCGKTAAISQLCIILTYFMRLRTYVCMCRTVPVAAQLKAWVCGRSLAGIADSNPIGDMDVCLVSIVCCQVEVSASGWSPVQRSPTEWGVSEYDRGASIMSSPWPTRGCRAVKKNHEYKHLDINELHILYLVSFCDMMNLSTGIY